MSVKFLIVMIVLMGVSGCTLIELNIAPVHKTIVDVGDGTTDHYSASSKIVEQGDEVSILPRSRL